jgi:hypothetical protein
MKNHRAATIDPRDQNPASETRRISRPGQRKAGGQIEIRLGIRRVLVALRLMAVFNLVNAWLQSPFRALPEGS